MKLYTEEDLRNAFDEGFHKGYNVGHADAESHPLALTIANHIHTDREKFIQSIQPPTSSCKPDIFEITNQ